MRIIRTLCLCQVPERFPLLHGCTFGVGDPTLQSIVLIRSFCLRVYAFPFGAERSVSPESIFRSAYILFPFKIPYCVSLVN